MTIAVSPKGSRTGLDVQETLICVQILLQDVLEYWLEWFIDIAGRSLHTGTFPPSQLI